MDPVLRRDCIAPRRYPFEIGSIYHRFVTSFQHPDPPAPEAGAPLPSIYVANLTASLHPGRKAGSKHGPETLPADVERFVLNKGGSKSGRNALLLRLYFPAIKATLDMGFSLKNIHGTMIELKHIDIHYSNFLIHVNRLIKEDGRRQNNAQQPKFVPDGKAKPSLPSEQIQTASARETPTHTPQKASTDIPAFLYNPTPNAEDLI